MIAVNERAFPRREPNEPRFAIGQLVRHRRYGYRGVVLAFDGRCLASPAWYMANQTQPDRDQPWYHVLVDGGNVNTYAAESSLAADEQRDPVEHPLVTTFFEDFVDGRYVRNDVPFPPEDDA